MKSRIAEKFLHDLKRAFFIIEMLSEAKSYNTAPMSGEQIIKPCWNKPAFATRNLSTFMIIHITYTYGVQKKRYPEQSKFLYLTLKKCITCFNTCA